MKDRSVLVAPQTCFLLLHGGGMRRGVNRDGSHRSKVLSLKVLLACWRGLFSYLTETSINKAKVELSGPEGWGREKLKEILGHPWFLTGAHLSFCRQTQSILWIWVYVVFQNLDEVQNQYHNFACLSSIAASNDWHTSSISHPDWDLSKPTCVLRCLSGASQPSAYMCPSCPSLRSALCCLTGEMQLLRVCPCENRMSSAGSSAH